MVRAARQLIRSVYTEWIINSPMYTQLDIRDRHAQRGGSLQVVVHAGTVSSAVSAITIRGDVVLLCL